MEREATALFSRLGEQFALSATARARLGLAELHRRTLQAELPEAFGTPNLRELLRLVKGATSDVSATS